MTKKPSKYEVLLEKYNEIAVNNDIMSKEIESLKWDNFFLEKQINKSEQQIARLQAKLKKKEDKKKTRKQEPTIWERLTRAY